MKLYVDDLRKCPDGWVLARSVTEAIRILATQSVDEVSLDHDICHSIPVRPFKELGGLPFPIGTVSEEDATAAQQVYEHGIHFPVACPETFEPVARYIALMPKRPKVQIHTANPLGRDKMTLILSYI